MRVVPVIDLMGGVVVRGVGGRRESYRPVQSVLTSSCHPLDVAKAFRDRLGLTSCYVADLDAIAGAPPDLALVRDLRTLGLELWVDAGVRTVDRAMALAEAGVDRVVIGSETVESPDVLGDAASALGASRVVFSLDLLAGMPMGNVSAWGGEDPFTMAAARETGVADVLVLDLRSVGVGAGPTTLETCRRIATEIAGTKVHCGGGVRGVADLRAAEDAGVASVLVASALHAGTLSVADVSKRFGGQCP